MADFSFTPAATGIKPVPQTSLADMIGVARGAQAYQQAQQVNPLQVQQAQAELQRIQGLMPEEIKRAQAEANVAEQTQIPRISAAASAAGTAASQMNTAQLANLREQQSNFSRESLKLLNRENLTPQDIDDFLVKTIKNAGGSEQVINQARSEVPKTGTTNEMKAWLARHALNSLTAEAQIDKLFPAAQMQNVGGGIAPFTMGSPHLAAQPPGTQVGAGTELSLPPTTTITDPATGQSTYLGKQFPRQTNAFIAPTTPIIAGVGAPQAAMLTATGTVVGPDWVQTVQDASTAQSRIGLFQDIKKYSADAFTGVGGARKELSAGILRLVGIDAYTAEQTATEQLAKNANLLALAGGNTDAARSLAEAANPNKKLNEESIKKIADQLIGVEKMKLAKQQYLQPFSNNAQEYQKRKLQFDNVADPRLFQEMTPESVAKLKASLSPAAIKELTDKIKAARALGII
jgi:hypothetical protein